MELSELLAIAFDAGAMAVLSMIVVWWKRQDDTRARELSKVEAERQAQLLEYLAGVLRSNSEALGAMGTVLQSCESSQRCWEAWGRVAGAEGYVEGPTG